MLTLDRYKALSVQETVEFGLNDIFIRFRENRIYQAYYITNEYKKSIVPFDLRTDGYGRSEGAGCCSQDQFAL